MAVTQFTPPSTMVGGRPSWLDQREFPFFREAALLS